MPYLLGHQVLPYFFRVFFGTFSMITIEKIFLPKLNRSPIKYPQARLVSD